MNISPLRFEETYRELVTSVPEIIGPIEAKFGSDYDLSVENPGEYPIFEEVVQGFLLDNLERSQDPAILTRLFDFFERMATSGDKPVIDLLRIAILESLVFRSDDYARAIPYMGPETTKFARMEMDGA
jgi:hypothetical protein